MIRNNGADRPAEQLFRQEQIGSICDREPATVFRATTLAQTLELLRGDSGGCVVVVETDGGQHTPVGIFTERDHLDKIVSRDPAAWEAARLAPIESLMTPSPRTIAENETLDTAIQLMTKGGYRHLPLVDGAGRLVGVVSARDIIRYLAESFPVEVMNLPPRLHQDERIHSREGG